MNNENEINIKKRRRPPLKLTADSDYFLADLGTIGSVLKSLRLGKKLRQSDIAEALQITPSAYSHYERNKRLPDLVTIIRISNFYKINIVYLLFLSCITATKRNDLSVIDVFDAYSHSQVMPEDDAVMMSKYKQLSPENQENLMVFLGSALDCDDRDEK